MKSKLTKVLNFLVVAVGLLSSVGAAAQSIKIDALSGKVYRQVCVNELADVVCSIDSNLVSLYSGGASALGASKFGAIWKHDYLPFEMACAAGAELTSANRICPATYDPDVALYPQYINAISSTADGKPIILLTPQYDYEQKKDIGYSFLNMSLPMGFRFKSYSVTLRPATAAEAALAGVAIDESVDISVYSSSQKKHDDYYGDIPSFTGNGTNIGSAASPSEQTFSATDNTTLSNNLYFKLCDNSSTAYVAVVIEDATFEFECVPFTVTLNGGLNQWHGYATPFNTGRLNLGNIYAQWNEQGSDICYGYEMAGTDESGGEYSSAKRKNANIRRKIDGPGTGPGGFLIYPEKGAYEMLGSLMLYDKDAMKNSLPTLETNTDGKIYTIDSKNDLKEGTYYIETPVAASQWGHDPLGKNIEGTDSASVPVGYRITGLTMNFAVEGYMEERGFYIKADEGDGGYYLDYFKGTGTDSYYDKDNNEVEYTYPYTSLTFRDDKASTDHTVWYYTGGRIYTKYDDKKLFLYNHEGYELATTESDSEAGMYTIEGKGIRTYIDNDTTKYYFFKDSDDNYFLDKDFVYDDQDRITSGNVYGCFLYDSYCFEQPDDYYPGKTSYTGEPNSYGVDVEVYTNNSDEPLITLSKAADATTFTVTDEKSQITSQTSTTNAITLTLGSAADAKQYINNDAVKIVVKDSRTGTDDAGKRCIAAIFDVQLEPLNPYISSLRVAANDNSTDLKVVGATFEKDLSALELSDDAQLAFTALHNQNYLSLQEYGGNAAEAGYSMYGLVKSKNYKDNWNGELYSSATAAEYVEASNMPTSQFRWNNLKTITSKAAKVTSMPTAQLYTERLFSEDAYASDGGVIGAVKSSDIFYFVTDDKPAFNISPAPSLRHKSYAYYMEETYKPFINFTKIYDTTFRNDAVDSDPFYGASVLALNSEGVLCNGSAMALSLAEVNKAVTDAIADETVAYADGKPSKLDRLLYLDASNMSAVKIMDGDDAATADYGDLSVLRGAFAKNAMVYIPSQSNVSVAEDNVVKKTNSGYEATANVVLTDKEPMFIPTSFTTTSGSSVEYVRNFTTAIDGRVGLNTFVLPFALPLSDGVYEGNLKLYTLKASDCLTTTATGEGTDYYDADATFTPVTGSATVANTPYLAVVQKAGTEEDKTFTIKLTDEVEIVNTGTPGTDGVAVKGATSTGSVDGASVSFTSYGTYSGAALPKDDGYFYFGKDKLYKSNNLAEKYPNVLMYPFRVYYDFAASAATAKKIAALGVNFDGGEVTGINEATTDGGIVVTTGKGTITVTALTDTDVAVYGLSGQCIDRRGMAAGENRTMATGSGLYLVNGQKVVVK